MILESALFVLLTTSAINQPQKNEWVKSEAIVNRLRKEVQFEILWFRKTIPLPKGQPGLLSVTLEQKTSRISAAPRWAM